MKKTKWLLAFIVTILIMPLPCYAQEWARTYGGSESDRAYAIQQCADGGYIVAGETDSFVEGDWYPHLWVLKLDAGGRIAWQKKYGSGMEPDRINSVKETLDQQGNPDGYIVAGYKGGGFGGFRRSDAWVLKLDMFGDVVWQKTYGTVGRLIFYEANSIQQTDDSGYIVAGHIEDRVEDRFNIWIAKLDASGSIVWQKTHATTASERANAVQQTEDGSYVVAGKVSDSSQGIFDAWIVKLDSYGNVLWQRTYGGSYDDYDRSEWANSMQPTEDGGYIVAGHAYSFYAGPAGDNDAWILKLDSDGDVIWEKTYGGSDYEEAHDYAMSVQETADDGYVVAGRTESFGAGHYDVWVLKLDSDGDVVWEKTYGGIDPDYAASIQETAGGGYILAGATGSFGAGADDVWVLKLDANGEIRSCGAMATSNATVKNVWAEGQVYTADFADTYISPDDTDVTPLDTEAETRWVCSSAPIIEKIIPRPREAGKIVRIIGYFLGDTPTDGVIHIGPSEIDSSSPRIKIWRDREIKFRLPKYKCKWFKGKNYRDRKIWVTVNGAESNEKRLKILKPDSCP